MNVRSFIPGFKSVYVITTFFLVALSIFVYTQINQLIEASYLLNENAKASLELDLVVDNLRDAQSAQRDYLLTHDSAYIVQFEGALREYPIHLEKIKALLPKEASQLQHLGEIVAIISRRKAFMYKMLELDKIRPVTQADTRPAALMMDTLRIAVSKVKAIDKNLLIKRDQILDYHNVFTPFFLLGLTLVSLTILLTSYLKINNTFLKTNQLQNALQNLVMESPTAICVFRGPEHMITLVNEMFLNSISNENQIGRSALNYKFDFSTIPFHRQLDLVYQNEIPWFAAEVAVNTPVENQSQRYFNFSFSVYYNSDRQKEGVVVRGIEVTEQVFSRQKVEEKEEQLRIAIEAGGLGTFDYYLNDNKLIWSDKTKELFGFDVNSEIDYAAYTQSLHPDDKATMALVSQEIAKPGSGGTYDIEYRIIAKRDQSIKWIRSKGKAQFNDKGKPVRFTGVVQEITQRKEAEAILKENESRFRLLAETLPQLVWVTDANGAMEYASNRWSEITGVIPDGADEWSQVVHPDDLDSINHSWAVSLSTGISYLGELRLKMKSGEYRWFKVHGIPVRDKNQVIVKWVGALSDIHREKQFTNELEKEVEERTIEIIRKNAELEKINSELESFTYIASHDLQEPLRKILMNANLFLEREQSSLSGAGKNYLEKIHASANNMRLLIEDLLTFSKLNDQDVAFEKIDLSIIVNEVVSELSETISEKNALIEILSLPSLTVVSYQWKQLLTNLISNALKFSHKDARPHVIISSDSRTIAESEKEQYKKEGFPSEAIIPGKKYDHIFVSDNGIGFDPQFKEQIFRVFTRLHLKHEYKGTGIGLAIVKKIAENHNGFAIATSEPGKGATFHIYIPATE